MTVALVALLFLSQVRLVVKLFLLGTLVGVSLYLLHHNLFNSTPFIFVCILTFLVLPGGHPSATNMWFIVTGIIAFVYTLAKQFPAIVLLGILVTVILAGYVMFLTMFAYHALDTPAFTVYLSVLYLFWYAWIHNHQLRLPPA